ncbi:MAG: hypothetical protein JNM28_01465 [Armatimonadetes bacterium]|nr:hypothetical protein [Armatimonadota bacterium]
MSMPPLVPSEIDPFAGSHYYLKRQLLKMIGATFDIYDSGGQQVLQAQKKGFKLKEDIRIFGGPGFQTELVGIFARQIIDFSAAYDVMDARTGQKIGAFQRKGWASLARDEWTVMNAMDQPVAVLIEDQLWMALVRRLLTNLIPQNYDMLVGEMRVADLKQNFNPFTYHLAIDCFQPPDQLDRRMVLAGACLLASIEGRQSGG